MSPTDFKDIKVIGFDLDQTLYPKSPEVDAAIQKYIYDKIATRLNIGIEAAERKFKEFYHTQGLGGTTSLIQLGFPPEEAGNVVQVALENADIAKFLHPNPRLITLLHKLKEKYALDIITGSNQNNTSKKFSHLEIPTSLFTNIITSDEGSKSSGTSYELWLSKYPQYSPEQFLYIGDRPRTDYEIPKTFGIKSILVNMSEEDGKYDCAQLSGILEIVKLL
jgi:FMN phosphatase YigB (HAD superfamily)